MESGVVALWVAILVTPLLIRWLRSRKIGQQIRDDGPSTHSHKAGTPTMGGLGVLVAVVVGYAMGHVGTEVRFTRTGYLVVIAVLLFGGIGFLDDWIKVRHRRSLGLNKRGKIITQVGASVIFAELALHWAHTSTALSFTRAATPGVPMGQVAWVVFVVLVLVGTSNAVNLTDGLDGLAAGSATFCFAVLSIIGYWVFRHYSIYKVLPASALDLALCSVALAGACIGFLWWNAAPAKIIMGDTGSLAIGSGIAALCLLLNVDLLLPIIGGLFVLETLSVIVQVFSFRLFHRRVFRMAPFHHHFELKGWPETTVIVRFWILAGLFAAIGLGLFYGEYLAFTRLA
ncbi:MAG: phospho-N-acetylmuramoyl-pentapeptide-transferase [Actinobacteria bacterium]|jgi:phospho-N-acetylmuramoyl-pentapeptide-transferase|nr:phospho-N-acetylmuramoyl-pentapeptide-transferase [Actinomycetota bacterium]MCL5445051.1 phospho-N-acetylmuramoyl-pentapeptide-transferase [Actinomycetota bacterium]